MAVWEGVLTGHIPGIFVCRPVCLYPGQTNTDADRHSVGPLWLKGDHSEASPYTPHGGRMELQCEGPSATSLHL